MTPSKSSSNRENPSPDEIRTTEGFSLLWPPARDQSAVRQLNAQAARDLAVDKLLERFCANEEYRRVMRGILFELCTDPPVIEYRQAVLADLLRHPALVDALRELLSRIDDLVHFTVLQEHEETSLRQITWRAGELAILVECIQSLSAAFDTSTDDFKSDGLRVLREIVRRTAEDDSFQQLQIELPDILKDLRTSASITVGINLDQHLQPEEAVLLSVNAERFKESTMLNRLFGGVRKDMKGIAPLHTLPIIGSAESIMLKGEPPRKADPMMVPLFRDLSEVLGKTIQPLSRALSRYTRVQSRLLVDLHKDLIFYITAVDLVNYLEQAGMPMCKPDIQPADARLCEIEGCYNINLALHLGRKDERLDDQIVANEVIFGPQGRIIILTGPNQGGKTTYMQAIGLAQILAQVGFYVPGKIARISPVDGIYTHYPAEEKLERGTGRFGDEARRIHEIFRQVTAHSLVLLNEALVGTNPGESLYLAQDIVRVLRMIGARAIFTTHMHELAASVDQLNEDTTGDSKIISMVASLIEGEEDDETRSYTIQVSPPVGRSYADQIARQHGISYEQLLGMLNERGVLNE